MITSIIQNIVLSIAVFGAVLNWWNGWVILLVMTAMIRVKKNGQTV